MWAPARWVAGLGALLLASAFVVDEATREIREREEARAAWAAARRPPAP